MIRKTLIGMSMALLCGLSQAATPLSFKIYNAGPGSFRVNSTLLFGEKEALVIDAGFTRADGLRIAANVLDSGKQLKTIYVSQADPDYYFGVETLKEIFPDADVVTTPAVLAKLKPNVAKKIATWAPRMGVNAPRTPVLPRAIDETSLSLEGHTIELRGTEGVLAHRPYAWVPSLKAIVGNIGVFGVTHVWMADTQKKAERQAWVKQLDEMAALEPDLVVPGHMPADNALDKSAISFTKEYLETYERNLANTQDSGQLIEAMRKAYPNIRGGKMSLEIGAKVNKGEMKW